MKKIFYILFAFGFLAFGENVQIMQQPAPAQNQPSRSMPPSPSMPPSRSMPPHQSMPPSQNTNSQASQCPTEDAMKGYLISHNLATYTIVAIIPSKAVPGYCDVILQNPEGKAFFIRIRNDMAYVIAGSVLNAATNEVQTPDMSKYTNQQNNQRSTSNNP